MIIDIGPIDYEKAYGIQKEFVRRRKRGEVSDSLILAEHHPVFTIGRLGRMENLLMNEGLAVLRVDRGGDITFHGPGQLIAYPIIHLKERGLDLHGYMRSLESAAISFLGRYSVTANRRAGLTGVWVGAKKIASIGIAASGWVTYHGISINLNVDTKYFSMINPCGMKDVEVTSLSLIAGGKVSMTEAKRRLIDSFDNLFEPGELNLADYKYETALA